MKANVTVIATRIMKARCKMIGKVLRLNEMRPVYIAFKSAMYKNETLTSRKGRPITNLFDLVVKDNYG